MDLLANVGKPSEVDSEVRQPLKMECFVKIVNGFKPLTIFTKHSILDVDTLLNPPLPLTIMHKALFYIFHMNMNTLLF